MLLIRLSSFIFMLMFTLLEARDSIFKHHPLYQGILEAKITTNEYIEAEEIRQTIAAKEIKSISISPEEESNIMRLNGRKLTSKGGLKKEKANTKAKKIGKMMPMDGRSTSKISGATTSSCNNNIKGKKRRKMDVICNNQRVRSSIPKKKAKFPAGFVALSADYHFPNSHPPRHN